MLILLLLPFSPFSLFFLIFIPFLLLHVRDLGIFNFTILACDSAIVGPPDTMEWLQSLEFTGVVFEGRLIGTYTLSAYVQTLPPLKPGESRVDRFAIADQVRY